MRSALVTGASRGIGAAIAAQLAARGYALTVTARDPDRLAAVRDGLLAAGAPRVEVVAGDLAAERDVEAVVARHRDAYGGLSTLVLNAGTGTAGPVADYPLRRFDRTFEVNLRAPFRLVQLGLPLLRAAAAADPERGARIVVLASLLGAYPEPGLAAYSASKAALLSLVESINQEESAGGVSATAIAPGYVDTDMSQWVTDRIPAAEMIPVADVVRLVGALLDLSARTVVGRVVVSRRGTTGRDA